MMQYTFPHITNLEQVREAIKGRDEFIVAEREFGYVVNYLVNLIDSFPRMNTRDPELNKLYAIRRECRGIKFDYDGNILARPFHKFFNLEERDETMSRNVDFDVPFVILDKLDGSMVHPIMMDNEVVLCTKMGITDVVTPVQEFAEASDVDYIGFCKQTMAVGYTPIFEWCSRQQRIVVDYPTDQLILTAMRDMVTGEYLSAEGMKTAAEPFNVPLVKQWEGVYDGIANFVEHAQGLEDEEGYVIRFNGGHMLKVKNLWYVQLHKIKELLQFEKDVWALVLDEKHDDAKAFMEEEDKQRIDAFADDLFAAIAETADRLNWIVIAEQDNLNGSKKRFALEIAPNYPSQEKGLLFKIWDGGDAVAVVREFVREHISTSTKVEEVRSLVGGITWERY